jgi:diguanylate cyclase (GGDEF)-like protein
MAQAIRAREEDLRHRASTDELTGLLNRRELLRLLELLLIDAGRDQALHGLALLFCDLDLFKDINDNFGHAAGDLVLRCVGRRIRAHIRDADLAARVGGDEIIVVLRDISDPADALAVAQAIRAAIAQPIRANGIEAVITASIGVTWAHDQEDVDSLMARADLAMYRAKQDGRNRVVPFA